MCMCRSEQALTGVYMSLFIVLILWANHCVESQFVLYVCTYHQCMCVIVTMCPLSYGRNMYSTGVSKGVDVCAYMIT